MSCMYASHGKLDEWSSTAALDTNHSNNVHIYYFSLSLAFYIESIFKSDLTWVGFMWLD